jgi:proline iminopeptidase
METHINIGRSKIWVTVNGQGLPCILCNGGPGCDDYLGPVSAMIQDICRVVRFEPRGCGRSDYDGQYEIERTVDDIEAIRSHFGFERIVIGGHSAGPDIALAYTIKNPNKVAGIFGIAGGRIVNDRDWSAAYKQNLTEIGEDSGGKEFVADPKVNEIGNRSWREYIKRDSLLSDIASIKCPALFVSAEKDIRPNWPTKQLARLIRNGRYCEIKDAAHVIWLTHADELREKLCRFLRTIAAAEQGARVDTLTHPTQL